MRMGDDITKVRVKVMNVVGAPEIVQLPQQFVKRQDWSLDAWQVSSVHSNGRVLIQIPHVWYFIECNEDLIQTSEGSGH